MRDRRGAWQGAAGRAAHDLAELTDPAVRALTEAVAEAASTVVVVEPGTPAGHDHVLRAREQLLARGFAVAAPCPHAGRCPLQEGPAWCHSSVRLDRSPLHRRLKDASLGFEDEKLSYGRPPVGAELRGGGAG